MEPFYSSTAGKIFHGDAGSIIAQLPEKSVHCVVTSPPYYRLRAYSKDDLDAKVNELGTEAHPDLFVNNLVAIFRDVRRVMRDDATLWVNLGDTFAANRSYQVPDSKWGDVGNTSGMKVPKGIPAKSKMLVPFRFALAMLEDGWVVRQDIIWNATNRKPESVEDRPNTSHEYIFQFAKSEKYFYDYFAVLEPAEADPKKGIGATFKRKDSVRADNLVGDGKVGTHREDRDAIEYNDGMRNLRSVWSIPTQPSIGVGHFALFPEDLPRKVIMAATSERGCCANCGAPYKRIVNREFAGQYNMAASLDQRARNDGVTSGGYNGVTLGQTGSLRRTHGGWEPQCSCNAEIVPCTVLDPFFGGGTTGIAAQRLYRSWIGVELVKKNCEIAKERIIKTIGEHAQIPMFF